MKRIFACTLLLLILAVSVYAGEPTFDATSEVMENTVTSGEAILADVDETVGAELVFYADFGDGTVNPTFHADWVNTAIASTDLTLTVVKDPDPAYEENYVLKVRRDGQFGFINLPFDEIQKRLNRPGEYYLTYDVYYPSEYPGFPAPMSTYYGNSAADPHNFLSFSYAVSEKGTWKHIERTTKNEVITAEDCIEQGVAFNANYTQGVNSKQYPMAWINRMYIYDFGGWSADDTYEWYIDNICIWYKPYTVVTFELCGIPEMYEEVKSSFGSVRSAMNAGDELPEVAVAPPGTRFAYWVDDAFNIYSAAPENDITLYAYYEAYDENTTFTDGNKTAEYIGVPNPEEIGFASENFICWLEKDGTRHFPGEEATESIMGKTLTAFYQDATKPAMAYAYEGSPWAANNVNFYVLQILTGMPSNAAGNVIDTDGRNVLRLSGTQTAANVRLNFAMKTPIDPLEYYIVSTRQKNTSLGNEKRTSMNMYYIVNGVSPGYAHDGLTHIAAGKTAGVGEFEHVWNMKADPALENMTLYRWGDPNVSPWKVSQLWYDCMYMNSLQTVEVDSINFRIYRGGHTNVNYYDGDTLLFSETDRGVGTGYLLSSAVPKKEGYIFAGWADEEGNLYEGNKLDLVCDTDVYAVFTDKTVSFGENGRKIGVNVGESGKNGDLIAALYDANGRLIAAKLLPKATGGTYIVNTGEYNAAIVKMFAFDNVGRFKPIWKVSSNTLG